MLVSPDTAKALFCLIFSAAQGVEIVRSQQPLRTEDRGDAWLVAGTPFSDALATNRLCVAFFRKRDAQVTGIGCHGRMPMPPDALAQWRSRMTAADYDRIFGPYPRFEPDGIPDVWQALYHGIVTTPEDAVAYARAILGAAGADFAATERDGVWHVADRGRAVMAIARADGRILAGMP